MNAKFHLHAHEVWREGLVREGELEHSGDFRGVLPQGVWDESNFVFGRYSPRGREDSLVGHILFRPANGEEENFFCSVDVYGECGSARDADFCKMGEFVFGGRNVDTSQIQRALGRGLWGRVFYLDEEGLRRDEQERPCDWGVFIAASGLGLWKWTMRDGVTWGKASSEGIFRWHDDAARAARFLAQTPSLDVWAHLQSQLENPDSEMAFARRWLRSEDEERLDLVTTWANGSRQECEQVGRWLLQTEPALQNAQEAAIQTVLLDTRHEDLYGHCFSVNEEAQALSPRLENAFEVLRAYFAPQIQEELPLCARNSYIDQTIWFGLSNPTAHERLEAHQQLQTWARGRGLSFD